MRRIYVVGFAPADDAHAVGGFEWFEEGFRAEAVAFLLARLADGDGHSLTFVPMLVDDDLTREEVTGTLDANLRLIEVGA